MKKIKIEKARKVKMKRKPSLRSLLERFNENYNTLSLAHNKGIKLWEEDMAEFAFVDFCRGFQNRRFLKKFEKFRNIPIVSDIEKKAFAFAIHSYDDCIT